MHHVFWVQLEKYSSPVKWHSLFQLHPLKLHKVGFLSLTLALCFQEFSHFFSVTISKYKEIPGQFYPLLQWAKHISKTYMYFNLLLIISAPYKKINSKKKTNKQIHIFQLSFHVYSVKIIYSMLSDRQALITGQLQTTFAAVLIVPPVKLLVLCFNQTRICLFESHTHGLQSSIVATNSTGNNSNFITSISWKDGYARQGGSLEGSNVAV